ncbi:WSC domain-containing protein 2 [Melanomma pulvis-pyrius CBS 109.77]|uniref:WSC domain-containing protein 2 n=1 Tax=Melanomma pulvis-pyrius CBS 109.77 TaxID=1314802 RepID=A0A6A6XW66_9PLEO|nr:WSC domain-containing protein 2 [Melanomma pulvis-pyrius CBS 109.77]
MIGRNSALVGLLLACQQYATAAPTWPASTDDLEDIMLLNSGYRARGFATAVTPCSAAPGPGRIAAAEWIRAAFHDMATGNTYQKTGGLDASLMFEIKSSENIGSAFQTTLTTYAPFLSSRTSMADIISMGVYTATRSCGGPVIPVRGGHVDATQGGSIGVPLPQNPISIFKTQFDRFGYNATEMIQFTACGHSLGGLHQVNFPDVINQGVFPNDYAVMDTTSTVFDNRVVTEYLDGTTQNPLVVGKSVSTKRNSDYVVYNSDNNVTIAGMRDAQAFANTCKTMFQRMIEIVPSGVTLTDIITPYEIKPYDLQLTLLDGGSKINFTGDIRVQTTQRPAASISQVQLVYKDRTGAAASTPITATIRGSASGFDDTFQFYSFSAQLSAETSISSFSVVITKTSDITETWDNNGAGFKVDDNVIYQAPQSCLDASGKLTVVAAARNGTVSPNLKVVVKNPRASPIVVPALSTATIAMATQSAVGSYQLYFASYTFSGSQAQSAVLGVSAGSSSDNYKNASSLSNVCASLSTPSPTPTPSSSSVASSSLIPSADSTLDSSSTSMTMLTSVLTTPASTSSTGSAASSSNLPTPTLVSSSSEFATSTTTLPSSSSPVSSSTPIPSFPGYDYTGCVNDSSSDRTFTAKGQIADTNSYESCAAFCSGYMFFGVEYGTECYCGNALPPFAAPYPDSECNMPCAGNRAELCGAGYRLTVFKSLTLYPAPSNPAISGYTYSGCYIDNVNVRVLGDSFLFAHDMTVPMCAGFCAGKKYFGVEYGEQCWCGDALGQSGLVDEWECSMECSGDQSSFCGAGNRIGVWVKD